MTTFTKDHDFKTLVLDSIDFAEPLLWAHVCAADGKKNIEEYGYGKGYLRAMDEARLFFRGLEALRNKRGMAIIITSHCEVRKHEAPDSLGYDRYQLSLDKRLGAFVHDWVDALLFAQWKVHVVKEDKGFGGERTRGVGSGERVLYTEERPGWWAKNRYALPAQLPLSWTAFVDAMNATTSTNTIETKNTKAKEAAKS